MKARTILLPCTFWVFVTFSLSPLSAQNSFAPGVIVTAFSDTIKGLLSETNEMAVPVLAFKKNETAETSIYKANDIISYRIGEGNYYEVQKAALNGDTIFGFFQCHIKGPVSLYSIKDKMDKQHIYASKNTAKDRSGLLLLEQKNETVLIENATKPGESRYSKKTKPYLRVLRRIFLDCPDIFSKLSSYSFTLTGMKKAVYNYYTCTQENYEDFKPKKIFPKPVFGIYGGLHKISKKHNSEVAGTWNFSGGIYADIFLASTNKRFSVQPHLVASRFSLLDGGSDVDIHVPVFLASHFFVDNSDMYFAAGYDFGNLRSYILGAGYKFRIKKIKLHTMWHLKVIRQPASYVNLGIEF